MIQIDFYQEWRGAMTRLNTKLFSHTRKYSTFSIFWVEEKPGDVCTTQMQKVKTAEFISFFMFWYLFLKFKFLALIVFNDKTWHVVT